MSTHALGIMVSAGMLHAVLLERTDGETTAEMRLSSGDLDEVGNDLSFGDPGEAPPGMEGMDEEADDVTIQFGEEGGNDMFMASEFGDIDGGDGSLGGGEPGGWNVQAELDDLLKTCEERGYEDPEIAFCSTTEEIDDVELRLSPDESPGDDAEEEKQGLPLPADRSTLLDMLAEQYEGTAEEGRVGFVPMHRTGDGHQRVLALIARPGGPVLSTLAAMQDQTLARSPRARLLDAEVSLYLGLARSMLQLPPGTPEKTILVRSGPEDTLVLFIEGNTLRQSEHLPELTSADSAETICSRVLLLQDEYGMGEVQHLLLLAEDDEEVLADAFKSYFAGANLQLLREHLPGGEDTDTEAYAAATGVALRLLDDPARTPFFQPINLLAKEYTASRFRLPVGWSVPALLALLALTTLGFVWYYFANASAISERRAELRRLEQAVQQVDPDVLQARIDSLQSAAAQYADANAVMAGLLRGSNKWSDGLATMTGEINQIGGLSVDEWSPQSGTSVAVVGRSTERANVVKLAQRLGGGIQELVFTETRDVSLYDFRLTVPLDTTKPAAIDHWREQQRRRLSADGTAGSPRQTRADTAVPAAAGTGPQSVVARAPVPNDTLRAGWTVVVASLLERGPAETVAQRFRRRLDDRDHPVRVRHDAQRGRYRVGVGAFASAEAALSVLQALRGTLSPDAWLLKLSETGPGEASPNTAESPADSARTSPERSG
jgi:hypothetical protein